jgi:hypothetical protein
MEAKKQTWYVEVNNSALFKKVSGIDVAFFKKGMKCLQ